VPSSVIAGEPTYIPPKTKGSRRTVPLPAATTNLLRNYLKRHPHCADPTAPCSRACGFALRNLLAKTAGS
jgi:integrase